MPQHDSTPGHSTNSAVDTARIVFLAVVVLILAIGVISYIAQG